MNAMRVAVAGTLVVGWLGAATTMASGGGAIAYQQGSNVEVSPLHGTVARSIAVPASSTALAWSPDGRSLALVAQSGNRHLRVLVADAAAARRFGAVAQVDARRPPASQVLSLPDATPSVWSPDGRDVAFVADSSGHQDRLYVVDVRAHAAREIAHVTARDASWFGLSDVSQPVWSPDGSQIVFTDGLGRLYGVRADGSDLHRLTRTATCGPTFSPNGRDLAYVVGRGRSDVLGGGQNAGCSEGISMGVAANESLVVRNLAGGPVRILSRRAFGSPSWSPDGRRIAFPYECVGWPGGDTRCMLQVREIAGRAVATFGDYRGGGPRLSDPFGVVLTPDESHVVYGGDGGLFVANLGTHAVRALARGEADIYATSHAGGLIAFRYYNSETRRTGVSVYSSSDDTITPVDLTAAASKLVKRGDQTVDLSVFLE
jgi:hypothetical protein